METHEKLVNDNYRFTIESVIYGSYVKTGRLDDIVFEAFSNTSIASATELNVFIDVYSVLHQIFSESFRVDYSNYTDITSCLINMCAHYRSYFRRLKVHTVFYIVFSKNICDINRKFVAEYNSSFVEKSNIPTYVKITEDNFKLLSALCPYLPDIHFISSKDNYESSVIIAHLIELLHDGRPNMIISRDLYPLQLTYLYPNTTFLYPKKKKSLGDYSTLIPVREKPSYREQFWGLIKETRKIETNINISPVNFCLLMALNRFPDRNMKALYNIQPSVGLIYNMVGSEDIKIDISQLYTEEILSKYNISFVEARLNTLDINYMLPYYRNSEECKSISLMNLSDNNIVNMINAKYFANNPIDILKL